MMTPDPSLLSRALATLGNSSTEHCLRSDAWPGAQPDAPRRRWRAVVRIAG
jgi:hypothetical protein